MNLKNRRDFLKAGLCLLAPNAAMAQEAIEDEIINRAPQERGFADFAEAWEFIGDPSIVASGVSPEIPDIVVAIYSQKYMREYPGGFSMIFSGLKGHSSFQSLYNEVAYSPAGQRIGMKPIRDRAAQDRFGEFWETYISPDAILPPGMGKSPDISLLVYLIYSVIIIHETDGSLSRSAERYNPNDSAIEHPGIAYLFNKLHPRGSSFQKSSYNKRPNKTCLELFNDPLFINKFRNLPLSDTLVHTNDTIWAGTRFPKERYPTSGDPKITGIILETDFFKFRGRGLIQTTWRDNYFRLVRFLLETEPDFSGSKIVSGWKATGLTADQICTISTNEEWDRLFADPSNLLTVAAVKIHAENRNYLPVSSYPDIANSNKPGSILYFGKSINGSDEYAHGIRHRVYLLSKLIGYDF